jgi:mannose/fructose/N-acetylgalactosamine-specific phosphotransferase system component IIB
MDIALVRVDKRLVHGQILGGVGAADTAKVFHLGFRFQKLNLGNIHNEDCSKHCSSCVSLSAALTMMYFSLPLLGVAAGLTTINLRGAVPIFCAIFLTVSVLLELIHVF